MSQASSTCSACGYCANHQIIFTCPKCGSRSMEVDEELERDEDDNDGPENGEDDDDETD